MKQIYPNPANDFINITNVKGQVIKEVDLTEKGINTIDVSSLKKGIFQIVLT